MDAAPLLDTNVQEGFLDFLMGFFALVPVGFLLGMLSGLVAFAVFRAVNLVRSLI